MRENKERGAEQITAKTTTVFLNALLYGKIPLFRRDREYGVFMIVLNFQTFLIIIGKKIL